MLGKIRWIVSIGTSSPVAASRSGSQEDPDKTMLVDRTGRSCLAKGSPTVLLLLLIAACALLANSVAAQEPGGLPPLPIDADPGDTAPATLDGPASPDADPGDTAPTTLDGPGSLPLRRIPCSEPFTGEVPPQPAARILEALAHKDLAKTKVAVLAVAYPEGTVLFRQNADDLLNPASVTKLFTAAAVLEHLGPDTTFETRIVAGEGECPPLYLVGGGDPGLTLDNLRALARQVKKGGIGCASALFYDATLFDRQTLAPHYEEKQSDAHWRPHIGAAGIEDGAVTLVLTPGGHVGAAVKVETIPSCTGLLVDNRLVTVETPNKDKELLASVDKAPEHVVIRLDGEVKLGLKNPVIVRRAIPDPDLFSARCFRDTLVAAGVKVKADQPEAGTAPKKARKVASHLSDSLATDIRRMQVWSKNFVAEQVVKLAGRGRCEPLAFQCGLKVLRRTLERFHLPAACVRYENGSGLFDANRFTASHVVRLLIESANRPPIADPFVKALAQARKTGTLRDRMGRVNAKVRGKTGTLDGISALAGYIERGPGRYIAFAILMNGPDATAYRMQRIQDRIVELLAWWAFPGKKR